MSNSVPMLRRLSKLCRKTHQHQPLEGRRRTEGASCYPLPLLRAILQGMSDTSHSAQPVEQFTRDEYDASLALSVASVAEVPSAECAEPTKPGTLPLEGGGSVHMRYALSDFKPQYLDEYTREPLPHHLVREAIQDELNYFNAHVWGKLRCPKGDGG